MLFEPSEILANREEVWEAVDVGRRQLNRFFMPKRGLGGNTFRGFQDAVASGAEGWRLGGLERDDTG